MDTSHLPPGGAPRKGFHSKGFLPLFFEPNPEISRCKTQNLAWRKLNLKTGGCGLCFFGGRGWADVQVFHHEVHEHFWKLLLSFRGNLVLFFSRHVTPYIYICILCETTVLYSMHVYIINLFYIHKSFTCIISILRSTKNNNCCHLQRASILRISRVHDGNRSENKKKTPNVSPSK